MKLPDWRRESEVRAIFSWLSRIKAGPRFGSRPIGWYQMHMCHAVELLEKAIPPDEVALDIHCHSGIVYRGKRALYSVERLYNEADALTRK
jgi:hypothetical protein